VLYGTAVLVCASISCRADPQGGVKLSHLFRECHATCPQLTRRLSRGSPPIEVTLGLELS
jgi:hypothetical protein